MRTAAIFVVALSIVSVCFGQGSFVGFTDDEFVVVKAGKTLLRINTETGDSFFTGDVNAPGDIFLQRQSLAEYLADDSELEEPVSQQQAPAQPGLPPYVQASSSSSSSRSASKRQQSNEAPAASAKPGVTSEEMDEVKKAVDNSIQQISENLNRLFEQDKKLAEQLQSVINIRRNFKYVTPFQAVGTSGALAWKYFAIKEDHYLGLAQYNNETAGYKVESMVFKWDGSGFQLHTRLPTVGCRDLEFVTIGEEHFFIVANSYDGTNFGLESVVYKVSDEGEFQESQRFKTEDAFDLEVFKIGEETYMAVANHYNGKDYAVNSKIYKWDGSGFREHQSIATKGGASFAFFVVGETHYLALANAFNGTSCQTESKIMKWSGSRFEVVQSIATSCAFDWEYFTIDGAHYLAVANCNNGTSYLLDSKIYRFDGEKFQEHQAIPTSGAFHWESFKMGVDNYLIVANCNDGNSTAVVSKLYRWKGVSFVEEQTNLLTVSAMSFEFFEIGANAFLASAFQNHNLSPIYYVKTD